MKRLRVAIAALAAAASGASGAETIYRCGNEYTNVACAHATTVAVADAVTPSSAPKRATWRGARRRSPPR